MGNKFRNEWENYIVKTKETELLLAEQQKPIQLENFGQNKTTANKGFASGGLKCKIQQQFFN
jgi:hypothetical protein